MESAIKHIIRGAIGRLVQKYNAPALQNYETRFSLVVEDFWRNPNDEMTRNLHSAFVDLNIVQLQPHQLQDNFDFWKNVVDELRAKIGRRGENI